MSIVSLDPTVRKKVEAELKLKIPSPDEARFEPFLDDLRERHPELHRDLVSSIKVAKLPAEESAAKATRRARFKAVLDRLFFLTKWPEERVLDKRRVVLVGLGALGLLMCTTYLLSNGFQPNRANAQTASTEAPASSSVQYNSADLSTDIPDLTLPPQAPPQTPTVRPAAPVPDRTLPPPVAVTPAPPSPPRSIPPQALEPATSTPPPTLNVFTASETPQAITVWRSAESETAPSLNPDGLEVAASGAQPNPAISVFEAQQNLDTTEPLAINQGEQPSLESIPLTVYSQTPEDSSFSTSEQETNSPQTPIPQPPTTTADLPSAAPSNERVLSDAPVSFAPGSRIPATLSVGVSVTAGASVPIVAETQEGGPATWLGTATLTPSGRIDLTFTDLVTGTTPRPVEAVALDDEGTLGLSASVQTAAADVAQDLVQGAAGGVSDYLSALAKQKRTTITDGVVVQEGEVPGLETFMLGRLAQLLSPPPTSQAQVEVATLPDDTAFTLLYGIATND